MIIRGSISGISGGSEVTVLSYINTSGGVLYVRGIGLEGNSESDWTVYKNLLPIFKRKLTAADTSGETKTYDLKLENNDILTVKVIHNESFLAEFSADAIITQTKESDTEIVISFNFNCDLLGIMRNVSKLSGSLKQTGQLTGSMNTSGSLSGSIVNLNELNGIINNEMKLAGVVTCE